MKLLLIEQILAEGVVQSIDKLYKQPITYDAVSFQKTRKEFEGDLTLVVFPFLKFSKKSPEETGKEIGEYLKSNVEEVAGFNVIKGFLNLTISDTYWVSFLESGLPPLGGLKGGCVMIEYSCPNTNKPLHLGHIRNNLLGHSLAEILRANGHKVIKVNLINDRGVHICKSMLAWQKWGNGETPESAGMKGDKLVGKYYVEFEKGYKEEMEHSQKLGNDIIAALIEQKQIYNIHEDLFYEKAKESILQIFLYLRLYSWSKEKKIDFDVSSPDIFFDSYKTIINQLDKNLKVFVLSYLEELRNSIKNISFEEIDKLEFQEQILKTAKDYTPLIYDTHLLLRKWEAGDNKTIELWKKMNGWVYEGFDKTYKKMGVDFDKIYYESDTYLTGKKIVEKSLKDGILSKKEDGSTWCDLSKEGLDNKLLLRSDGTSVYMTQDIGTAVQRFSEFTLDKQIYIVGNEQEHHFKVLFIILKKMGYDWADKCQHLSYGMVDLPTGKMKSREGTVVDADDLMEEMIVAAKKISEESGKLNECSDKEKEELYRVIGLGALKYFILKVDPKKQMLFNPEESIDFNGTTGPFIQYTYARIQSIFRKGKISKSQATNLKSQISNLNTQEKEIIKLIYEYPAMIREAGETYSPAVIANYVYELSKEYNRFYHEVPILKAESSELLALRLLLSESVGKVIKSALNLLGIEVADRM